MGRLFRCVVTALASLQPLGALADANTLPTEPLSNGHYHLSTRFPENLFTPAYASRLAVSAKRADATDQEAERQRLQSATLGHLDTDQGTKGAQAQQKRAPCGSVPGTPVSGWNYAGCFVDSGSIDESFNKGFFWGVEVDYPLPVPQAMSAGLCTASCSLKSLDGRFAYAGINGNTCYCFNDEPTIGATAETCDTPCLNNEQESCGGNVTGSLRLTVFARDEDYLYGSAGPAQVTGWQYTDCYSIEGYAYVALADGLTFGYNVSTPGVHNDPKACITRCNDNGYWNYAGLLGDGCFCSNTRPLEDTRFPNEYCQALCPLNPDFACGGMGYTNWVVSVYQRTTQEPNLLPPDPVPYTEDGTWYYKGCYELVDKHEKLGVSELPDLGVNAGADACIQACYSSGDYELAGLYKDKCYCAHLGSYLTRDFMVPSQDCNTPCTGKPGEPCGGDAVTEQGGDAHLSITLYGRTLDRNITSPDLLPLIVPGTMPWKDAGCYRVKDTELNISASFGGPDDNGMSPEICIGICKIDNNWKYAAAYIDGTCACTGELPSPDLQLDAEATDCDNPCPGHETETCGTRDGGDEFARLRFWLNPLVSARDTFVPSVRPIDFFFDQSGKSLALL